MYSWQRCFSEHLDVVQKINADEALHRQLDLITDSLVKCYQQGGKLLVCGNGGSACDAQHIVGELVSRFFIERKGLYAEALSSNIASITAIGNDYSYEKVFQRQVDANGRKGDILLGLSTSGNSKNVILAMEEARRIGLLTVGITGENKQAKITSVSDYCIYIPSSSTPRIQEGTMLVAHTICEFVEAKLFC
ncbi:MAG: SIS domain-containing protein [Deltaproteobacteria bacterium]|nr:MAG: SIS domain-containing protein [Deltaproteobacteria bacterium]